MKGNKLVIAIFFVIFLFTSCTSSTVKNSKKNVGVSEDNLALKYFKELFPNKEILKCGEGDLNGDGILDLVVIFNESKNKNKMIIVIDKSGKYEVSNIVPAPVSNQKIEFRDIDKKQPQELIVSGSKGTDFGYAVFRLTDLEIIDLFGEGMEDCC